MDPAPSIAIRPEDRMDELLARLPGARRALFAAFHIGGCQSCAYHENESLAEVCAHYEIEVNTAIEELLASHERDREMLIEPGALKARLEAGEPVRLVDIRTREEHEAVRIENSELLTQESQQALFATPPEEALVLYDHRGRDVLDRCAWFRGHGLKNTLALAGGIDAWARELDPSLQRYRLEIE